MDIKTIFQSRTFRGLLYGLGIAIAVLAIFQAGMFVGFRKASFSYRWGENYHRNFGGTHGGFFGEFRGREFTDAHGVFGQVLKIDGSTLVIQGRDGVEKAVLVNDRTTIRRFRETISVADLKVDEYVTVIGDPNNEGQIEAKLIRIIPPPPINAPGERQPPKS